MTFKVKFIGIVTIFILSYIIYIIVLALSGLPNPVYKKAPDFINSNQKLKPIDAIIPDSISYSRYKEMKDSISLTRKLKNADFWPSSGINFFNLIAGGSSIECDTCTIKWFRKTYLPNENNKSLKSINYIQLPSWTINNKQEDSIWWTKDSVQFHVENDQAYIRKYIPYSPSLKNNNRPEYHMVDELVKFRYNKDEQSVMIPVKESVKSAINIIFGILIVVFVGYIFILMGDFIGLMADISKGLVFTDRNLRTLKRMAITLLAIPIAGLICNLSLRLIFSSYLTSDVVIKLNVLNGYWKFLAVGVIFLLIYRAFRQGKKLKDEQELTI